MISFTLILPPVGQMRDRIGSRGGFARSYKDKKQAGREHQLLAMAYAHRPAKPLEGAIVLGVRTFVPIPKTWSRKKREAAMRGEIRPTSKPDLSNIIKHLEDVFNGVFWIDDKQIVEYEIGTGKYYGYPARWEITIREKI